MDQPALYRRRLIFQERETRNLLDLPKTRTMLVCGVVAIMTLCVCVCVWDRVPRDILHWCPCTLIKNSEHIPNTKCGSTIQALSYYIILGYVGSHIIDRCLCVWCAFQYHTSPPYVCIHCISSCSTTMKCLLRS